MTADERLSKLKTLLGLPEDDTTQNECLAWILEASEQRLKNLLGGLDVPGALEYIVLEVSVIRFNRIGSEGVTSHSVEGESMTFSDDDFSGYTDEIEAYLEEQSGTKKGRVMFL